MINLSIAEENPSVRKSLLSILADESDVLVVNEFSSIEELQNNTFEGCCDVVLLNISLPGYSELQNVNFKGKKHPRVILVSTYADDRYLQYAVKSGASGYFLQSDSPDRLIEAVKCVASGSKYFPSNS